jgi:hypothetical protein
LRARSHIFHVVRREFSRNIKTSDNRVTDVMHRRNAAFEDFVSEQVRAGAQSWDFTRDR